jgi:hypothetical protein
MLRTTPGEATPPFFLLLVSRTFGGSHRLAHELWRAYAELYPFSAQTTAFHLHRVFDGLTTGASDTVCLQRIKHCQDLLPPAHLLAGCQRLSPEGPHRRKDVIDLEKHLLAAVDAAGQWK